MTEKARLKAYRALLTAEAQGENKHFPRVWVCGTHVFFSPSAAILQQREYAAFEGVNMPIDEVTYEEACQNDPWGREHPNWKDEVDWAIETARFSEKTSNKLKRDLHNSAVDPQKGKKEPKPKSKVAEVIGSVAKSLTKKKK